MSDTSRDEPPPATDPFPVLPADFGRYRVLRLLGRGGMGAVYLAEDSNLGRLVALKMPFFGAGDSHRIERFVREARSAAALQHPNICTLFDAGHIGGRPYITMAYVEGAALASQIGKPMPERRAVEIARKIALAMAHAHGKEIVHRDLKPANVMIAPDGEPVVMDFGLAKHISVPGSSEGQLTSDGGIVGTPNYMSPEQVSGNVQAVGPAWDVYSLGVVLFEMLTGKTPYMGNLATVMTQILTAPVPSARHHRPDVNPRLEAICRKAMAKGPANRFASMGEFADALGGCMAPHAPPVAPNVWETIDLSPVGDETRTPAKKRPRLAIWVAAMAAFAGTALLGVVIIRDKDGKEVARIPVPKGGSVVVEPDGEAKKAPEWKTPTIEPDKFAWKEGDPLLGNIVSKPRPAKGYISWGLVAREHEGGVVAAYRPGGKELATAGSDGVILIRDARTGKPLRVIANHMGSLVRVAWSPDGRYLASMGYFTGLKVWDPDACRLLREFSPHGITRCLAWSPDGRLIGAGTSERIQVWEAASNHLSFQKEAQTAEVRAIAFSKDGKQLASGSSDGSVRIWDMATGKSGPMLKDLPGGVSAMSYSPDGRAIAGTSWGGRFCLWSAKGVLLRKVEKKEPLRALAWAPGGRSVAFSSPQRVHVESTEGIPETDFDAYDVHSLDFSTDEKQVVAGTDYQGVYWWDAASGKQVRHLIGHYHIPNHAAGLAFSPDGDRIACASTFGSTWNVRTGTRLAIFNREAGTKRCVWGRGGKTVAMVSSNEAEVPIFDAESGKLIRELTGHKSGVSSAAVSPDGALIATGSNDGIVRVTEYETGKDRHVLKGHQGGITQVRWSQDGKLLATTGYDETVRIWDGGDELKALPGKHTHGRDVRFLPDGLVSVHNQGSMLFWDLKKKIITDTVGAYCLNVALSPDGKTLSGTTVTGVHLWDVATRKERFNVRYPIFNTFGTAWSPDGKTLAFNNGSRVHFLDPEGKERGVLMVSHSGPEFAVSPDGHFRGSPKAEDNFFVVALTADGEQRTFEVADFIKKTGLTNNPTAVRLLPEKKGAK